MVGEGDYGSLGSLSIDFSQAIRGVMVKEDFMPRILSFDTDSLTPELIKQVCKGLGISLTNFEEWGFLSAL